MDNMYISKHLQYFSVHEELKSIKINYATEDVPGGDSAYERVGLLVRNFELNPKGDWSGRGPSFFDP